MELKIGRHTYDITENDMFMDNGACIQLLSQSKERSYLGSKPIPVLSKKLAKKVLKMNLRQHGHDYGNHVNIFSIKENQP